MFSLYHYSMVVFQKTSEVSFDYLIEDQLREHLIEKAHLPLHHLTCILNFLEKKWEKACACHLHYQQKYLRVSLHYYYCKRE